MDSLAIFRLLKLNPEGLGTVFFAPFAAARLASGGAHGVLPIAVEAFIWTHSVLRVVLTAYVRHNRVKAKARVQDAERGMAGTGWCTTSLHFALHVSCNDRPEDIKCPKLAASLKSPRCVSLFLARNGCIVGSSVAAGGGPRPSRPKDAPHICRTYR